MPRIVECLDEAGRSPFGRWFEKLDVRVAAKVAAAVYQLEAGNTSEIKSVGNGVFERRIHYGPGYRIYFARAGLRTILLLGGGNKKTQKADIVHAVELWMHYKRRKRF